MSETTPARTIVHVDMDAFFASVEILRHPELQGRPVIVGGSGKRGVVAAASYEARSYGIHSAMPSVRARRLCPEAVFLDGDHRYYREVSEQIMSIFETFTPFVEPLSLDEAFLDVTGARRLFGDPVAMAVELRDKVLAETNLYCSIGIAENKFLAKLATSEAKPVATRRGPKRGVGVFCLRTQDKQDFLDRLPIGQIWGVGPATLARLAPLGINTSGDLRRTNEVVLAHALGAGPAARLIQLAHGVDDRPVITDTTPKSISHEETFADDIADRAELHRHLVRQVDAVASRLRGHGLKARTVQIKVRYGNFDTVTRSHTLDRPFDMQGVILDAAVDLLDKVRVDPGVRLLGVGVASLDSSNVTEQLTLDGLLDGHEASSATRERATEAVDQIRRRFGEAVIGPASASPHRGQGDQQWGPNAPTKGGE